MLPSTFLNLALMHRKENNMTQEEYRIKISELIKVGVECHRNRELTPPLNGTVSSGAIIPFIGTVATLAMEWENDTDGQKINEIINAYKYDARR